MLGRVGHLVVKEMLALLRDPRSRIVVTLPPLVQTLIFGYAATFDLDNVRYALLDRDGGPAARALAAEVAGSPTFQRAAVIHDLGTARRLIDAGQVLLVVHIDPRFSRELEAGRPASVQVLLDGRNSNTALTALRYVREIVTGFGVRWAAEQGLPQPPARLVARAWFNPNLESRWFIVPGIVGLLTQVVVLLVTALSVAREREEGTFDQLLVTPLRPVEILLGKALPGLLVGLAEGTLIVLLATLWFQVPLVGSLLTLYAGLTLFLLAAVGVGLAISSLAVTMQQGLLGAFLYMVPSIILSGFATPIANMPEPVQWLTYANPLRYFLVILRGVFLKGNGLAELWPQLWPLVLIALVSLSAATVLFRARMR